MIVLQVEGCVECRTIQKMLDEMSREPRRTERAFGAEAIEKGDSRMGGMSSKHRLAAFDNGAHSALHVGDFQRRAHQRA